MSTETAPQPDATTQPEGGQATQNTAGGSEPQAAGQQQPQGEDPAAEPSDTSEQPDATDPEASTEDEPEGAPETYEWDIPEGVELADEYRSAFEDAARDLNLPQEKAQGVLSSLLDGMAKAQERQSKEWMEAAKADKDIGGDKLQETLGVAQKAMDRFAPESLRAVLTGPSGLANHPDVIRMFHDIGKAISEDAYVGPGKGNDLSGLSPAERAQRLFYNDPKKQT